MFFYTKNLIKGLVVWYESMILMYQNTLRFLGLGYFSSTNFDGLVDWWPSAKDVGEMSVLASGLAENICICWDGVMTGRIWLVLVQVIAWFPLKQGYLNSKCKQIDLLN